MEDNDNKIDNKEEDSYHNKNLLNKKIKRNKKEKNENIWFKLNIFQIFFSFISIF